MINLSPFWQTVLTVCGVAFVVFLVVAGEVGRARVKANPDDVLGARLVLLGSGVRVALKSKPAEVLLPPGVRAFLVSLTESDRPAAPGTVKVTTVEVTPAADQTPVTKVPR